MKQKRKGLFGPKLIPNLISIFRAITALLFFVVTPLSTFFYVLYVVCAFTDVLDGFLARKLHAVSNLGQSLDSLADIVFFVAVSVLLVPLLQIKLWMFLWVVAILMVKLTSLLIGFVRFHKLSFLHTYESKLTGLLLFLFPVFIGWFGMLVPAIIISLVATVAAVEEQIILLKLRKLDRDIKGFYEVKAL